MTTPQPTGPPGDGAAAPLPEDAIDALTAALVAEHAAIFAYGAIGARLGGADADAARAAEQAHRDRRDALVVDLTADAAEPPGPEGGYALPFEVTGADDARQLAVLVEERVAATWRPALAVTTGPDRALVLDALVDAAVRATGWRAAAEVTPATVPFPGTPT